MKIRNELYKKHLIQEGKTADGIYKMLLHGYRHKHKGAIDVMQETGYERASPTTFNYATKLVMRQMGLME
jgi:hypothetical protein